MKSIIKIIIAFLLIGCLFQMPYSYYQAVRFVSFAGFIIIAVMSYNVKDYISVGIAAIGIIVFNPLFKLTFKRDTWQLIDKIFAAALVVWIVIDIVTLNRTKDSKV